MNLIPLRQRDFGLLWWADLTSITGDWALRIALPIYVLRLTGSPAVVSGVVLAGFLASLLVGTFAGAYVDRWDRRRVVVMVNVLQACVLLPLLAVRTPAAVWIVVVVAFAESALSQFFGPAQSALLPDLVSSEQLAAAISWTSVSNYVGRLIGPAVGGLIAVEFGLSGAAILDAATFVVAAWLCLLIKGAHRADHGGGRTRHLRRELIEGLRAIARNRITRAILIFFAITAIGEGMMNTLFAVYVTRALQVGSREMGWLLSAQAVGGIVGSLVGARVSGRFRPVTLASSCMGLFGGVDLAIFNYPRWYVALWPVIVMFFLIGVPAGVGYAAMMTLFQTQTSDRLRGRAFAVLAVSQAAFGMVGAAVAGALGQTVSVLNLLTAQGSGYLVAAILMRILAGRGPDSRAAVALAAAAPAGARHQPATPDISVASITAVG